MNVFEQWWKYLCSVNGSSVLRGLNCSKIWICKIFFQVPAKHSINTLFLYLMNFSSVNNILLFLIRAFAGVITWIEINDIHFVKKCSTFQNLMLWFAVWLVLQNAMLSLCEKLLLHKQCRQLFHKWIWYCWFYTCIYLCRNRV